MHIQWYPGHMTKAVRMMEENVKLVDAVLYMLDARAYRACFNPSFSKLAGERPIIYVLNKTDMIKPEDVRRIQAEMKSEGLRVIAVDSLKGVGVKEVITALKESLRDKIARYSEKGIKKTLRAMVLGVPNSGKSTLVNRLCGGRRAATGNRPGVTRGKQWVTIGDYVELLDTPGTLMPSYENQTNAKHLAYIGCIDEKVIGVTELTTELISDLQSTASGAIGSRYGVEEQGTPVEILERIASKRGCILRGGEVDYDRAAAAVLDDFRKLKLGRIALE